jgi:hypothetical protein
MIFVRNKERLREMNKQQIDLFGRRERERDGGAITGSILGDQQQHSPHQKGIPFLHAVPHSKPLSLSLSQDGSP